MTEAQRGRTLMRLIVSSSLRFRYLVVAAAVGMMVFGILQVQNMRVDVFPEFAPPQIEIQTICTGLSTSDVEQLVTVPLEQALDGTEGLDDMRSKSVPQLSSIVMIFKQGADLWQARQLVQERLGSVATSLPTWASPPVMLPPLAATARVMQIGVTSKVHDQMTMSMTAYWTIVSRMLHVDGVANVAIWGEDLQMRTVQVRPQDMQAHKVALNDVMEATGAAVDDGLLRFSNGNLIGTGGIIPTGGQQLNIQHEITVVTPADLAKVTVLNSDGVPVPLGQFADIKDDHQPLIGDAIIGNRPGLMLVVEKLPWADTVRVTQGVEDVVRMLQPGLPGFTFDTKIFQQADFIETSIHNLSQSLIIGFLLVVAILLLFLFEWRVALISLLTIPLSLMAAMLVLFLHGDTVNTMTLAGLVIALGAVVDDAIIDVENILRRLREARRLGTDTSTARIILDASLEVRSPIVYATLIIVAAAIPVFVLPGLSGAFFRPLAVSYTLAIVASMAVALTVTPALTYILLSRARVERRELPVARWLQRHYEGLLGRIVVRPRAVYTGFLAVALAAVLLIPQMGSSLFPTFKERDFLIHLLTTPGTSAQEQERMVIRMGTELRRIPGVLSFGTHIGQAFLGEEVAGVNFGENWLRIDANADLDKTLTAVRKVIRGYPGVYRDVMTYLNERIEEVLTGAKEPIIVRIYGNDLHTLRDEAADVEHRLGSVKGIADDHVDLQFDTPQIQVEVDLAKSARYGLKPGDVRRAASTLVAGEEVGDIFRNGKAYDTVVWSTPETRSSVAAISELPIDTPSGTVVALGDVATVTVEPNPSSIDRENNSRKIDVAASVEGRDLGSVVADVQKVVDNLKLPRGYDAEVLGEYTERQGAQDDDPRRDHRRSGDPAPAPDRVRQLAAGGAHPRHSADGAGGRGDRRLPRRRDHLHRLARRLLHRLRDRRAQRHPAHQPLAAPRGGGGDALRPRTGGARGEGAALANPDDLAGDRPGGGAAGRARGPARIRDRVPARRRHPRRADHLDAAQPVPRALALPALRTVPPPRGRRRGDGMRRTPDRRDCSMLSVGGRSARLSVLVVPLLLLAACGGTNAASRTTQAGRVAPVTGPRSGAVLSTPAAILPTPESDSCEEPTPFDAASFPDVPKVDNTYYPLVPGTQFRLDGTVVGDDGVKHPHRIETTVTDLTKTIDGVHTVVLFDRDLQGSTVQKSEIYFQAQDASGAAWNMGEYPEKYTPAGALDGAPKAWLPGQAGAEPGLSMPAHPKTGTPTYNEGLAPSVDFKDCATIVDTGRHTCAGPKCYDNVVVVDEYAPDQQGDGHQEKFMAPGIGNIQVAAAGGVDPEALQLTSASKLCAEALAKIDQLALQEDQRAYAAMPSLWGSTTPAAQTLSASGC